MLFQSILQRNAVRGITMEAFKRALDVGIRHTRSWEMNEIMTPHHRDASLFIPYFSVYFVVVYMDRYDQALKTAHQIKKSSKCQAVLGAKLSRQNASFWMPV